ncbi:PREDICTED: vegetative storage protein 1-like [Camelina sativa]|uniref:Vegetative storage protein 1-like n=1 Tax=Camelina sativa TaxID=90675 RepID=A0ABM1QD09_CAMSA|nr:PREDICTED: vegetative storage protein 1-like [Camelina sativa]
MKILSLSLLLFLTATVSHSRPSEPVPRLIELFTSTKIVENEAEFLEKQRLSISWHLGVETSNIINFKTVFANCKDYVEDYLKTSQQYRYDSKTVCKEAYFYAKDLVLRNDTYNVWIFDLDETLLSNIPFYAKYGYGTEKHEPETFRKWLEAGEAPVLPETLHLYQNILELWISPVLLTERFQDLEEVTLKNLKAAGFPYWRHVFFKECRPTGSSKKIANFNQRRRRIWRGMATLSLGILETNGLIWLRTALGEGLLSSLIHSTTRSNKDHASTLYVFFFYLCIPVVATC